MKPQIHEDPHIVAAAERQMQAWAHTQEIANHAIETAIEQRLAACRLNYVAISREAGAGSSEIAVLLGQRTGWQVLDKALLDQVADRFHESREMLDLVDETPANWVYDVLGTWMDRSIITHERYASHLTRVVLAAARRGKAIFVGRGAQFLLPHDKGLAVRLVASEKYRVARLMAQRNLGEHEARRLMQETDRGRRDFAERFFRRDIADPHCYDLVLNVERLGLSGTVTQIVAALCR